MLKINPLLQSKNFCGQFSVKMVLDYYGVEKDPEEIARYINASHESGCDPIDIETGVKKLGFDCLYKRESSIEEIKKYLDQNIAVIVQWFSPEENGHYSPVVGFEDDEILLADPALGKIRRMKVSQFILRWFEIDQYPPQNPCNFTLRDIIVISRNTLCPTV